MQRILILKVLGTKFPDCSNFTAHMASANQNIRDAVGHTPSPLAPTIWWPCLLYRWTCNVSTITQLHS